MRREVLIRIMAANQRPAAVNITSVLQEHRLFPPAREFSRGALVKSMTQYRKLYHESIASPEKFWANQARR